LGVRYGETDEQESYCEVFYKLGEHERDSNGIDPAGKIKATAMAGGTYAVAPGVHHFLEKDWQTFMNGLKQNDAYRPAGDCYEVLRIEGGKLHFYSDLHFYERVEPKGPVAHAK
jgi:hypothetical protein